MIPAPTLAAAAPWRTVPPAAVALFGASLLTMAALAHHPVVAHHAGPALLAELAQQGRATAQVHAVIIVLVGALLYGVIALALRLDLRRPAIAFGLAAYGLGCAAMLGAMLLDGFATPTLAGWLLAHGPAGGTPDIAGLALIAIGIQVLTKAGFVGMGLGMACLSWSRPASTRLLAALALPASLLPPLALAFGTTMAPHSLIMLTGLQALWYAAAAWTLWRGVRPRVTA